MIKMAEIEIKSMDKLVAKLQKLPEIYKDAIWDGAFDVVEKTRGYAVRELQSSVKHGTGELARSLKYEVIEKDGKIVGRLWSASDGEKTGSLRSDNDVAWFRELGTGLNGENSPKDLPEGFAPVYKQGPWLIPEAKSGDLRMYGMKRIKIGDSYWYPSNGQIARPFIMPSIRKVSNEADDIVSNRINTALHNELGGE
ncbi:HK97 gp10 family phage protein [Ligilactobacillus sp. WILCCON 0076]|uniref:HK97 gp10 family phage protein n=1 Tax=Ligilactobacillus ubinensis TaxID=2876789 RepID=A0A9X2FKD6_9LACO|nr:HK97 gp10 family phage protein [Ligilactobacillus ubinensis]MCP0886930.1 HK97 gp10 family phage protein [Ligilactobacillus ubinensis]